MAAAVPHLMTLADLSAPQIHRILVHSHYLKQISLPWLQPGKLWKQKPSQSLDKKTVALLFLKRSTRTRVSAETAATLLGGQALFLGKEDIQLGVNESPRDTARVIGGMCQGIFARVGDHSEIEELAKYSPVPVLNALSSLWHPTQILADLLTLHEHAHLFSPSNVAEYKSIDDKRWTALPELRPLTVAYIGDSANVLHDMLVTYPRFGHSLRIASPENERYRAPKAVWDRVVELECDKKIWWGADPKEAVHGADVVVTDTFIAMGQEAEKDPPESFSLPRDIMRREMPSLRRLDLTDMNPRSLLLSSLQCTPKLKELRVEGDLVMDGPMGPLTGPVQLPNLTYITIIPVDLESAAVFANIEYPPRADVFFRHDRQHRGEPDLSALVAMSRRFQIAPLPIDTAFLGCSSSGQLQIFIGSTHHSGPWQLLLNVESRYSSATCITLCSALSLGDVTILRFFAFIDMNPTELTSFYRLFPRVQSLHWEYTSILNFRTLMKSLSAELPLPALEVLHLSKSKFIAEGAELFEAVKGFLKERKDLGTLITTTIIRMCSITEEAVEELKEFTEVGIGSDEERSVSYSSS